MVGGGFVENGFGSADSFNRIALMSGYVVESLRCFPGILGKYDRSSSSPVSFHCYLPRVLFAKKDVLCKEYGCKQRAGERQDTRCNHMSWTSCY